MQYIEFLYYVLPKKIHGPIFFKSIRKCIPVGLERNPEQ